MRQQTLLPTAVDGWDARQARATLSAWQVENTTNGSLLGGAKRKLDQAYARIVRSLPWDKGEDQTDGRRLFDFDRVSPSVLIGRIPRGAGDVERLMKEEGVKAIVSAVEDWEMRAMGLDSPEFRRSFGLRWLVLPTPDFSSPSLEDLVLAAKFMMEEHARGEGTIYVHCNRGRSRSCIITLCFLVAQYGIGGEASLAHVRQTRPQVTLGPFFSSFWLNLGSYEKAFLRRYRDQAEAGAPADTVRI